MLFTLLTCLGVVSASLTGERAAVAAVTGQSSEITHNLLSLPSSRRAAQILSMPAGLTMRSVPLREGLRKISASYRISIWIDRRIDPTKQITVNTSRRETLAAALQRIAGLANAEMGVIENVVYFGPRGEAPKLQRAAVQLHDAIYQLSSATPSRPTASRRLPRQSANSFVGVQDLRWSELITPQEVVESIADNWNLVVKFQLPHDLMHAGELQPACTLATQLVVLGGGFDLEPSSAQLPTLELEPLKPQVNWQTTYDASSISAQAVGRLAAEFPQAEAVRRSGQWLVRGPTNYHLALLSPPETRRRSPREIPVSGDIAGPVEAILKQLAANYQLELQWQSTVSPTQKSQRIRFSVENATIAMILSELGKAASLNVRLDASTITVGN